MAARYFVTIYGSDAQALRHLYDLDFDLFSPQRGSGTTVAVNGLITLDDVGRLLDEGYEVLVRQTDVPKNPAVAVEFEEWLGPTLADLGAQQRAEE